MSALLWVLPCGAQLPVDQNNASVRLVSLPALQPLQHVSLALQGPRGLSYPFTCSIEIPGSLRSWLKFSCATLSFSGVVPAKVQRGAYAIPLHLSDNDGYSASFGLDVSIGTVAIVRLERADRAARPTVAPRMPVSDGSNSNTALLRAANPGPPANPDPEMPKTQFVRTSSATVNAEVEPAAPEVVVSNPAATDPTSSTPAIAAGSGGAAPLAEKPDPPPDPPPTISGPVLAGDNPVHGSAVASADGTTVTVQLERKRPGDAHFLPVLDPATTNAAGLWSVSYEVQDGDVLMAVQSKAGVPSPDGSAPVTAESVTNEREHTTFVGGTLLSQTGSDFSQQNLFLAFNTDRAFYVPGWYRGYENLCEDEKKPPTEHVQCKPTRHPGVNGFFEARLTAIPVNVSKTPTAATTTATPAASSATQFAGYRYSAPRATDATAAAAAAPSPASFISSQKSARVIVGGYMPFMFGKVPVIGAAAHHQTSTFFIAPIFRAGFDTLTDSTLQVASSTQGADSSGAVSTTPTATLSMLGSTAQLNRLYSFGTGGVRFATAKIGPGSLDTDHYLDITFGKFSNLESLYCPQASGGCLTPCPTGTTANAGSCTCPAVVAGATPCTSSTQTVDPTQEFRARIPRVSIEGYFRVPTTGFIVGISANIGQNSVFVPPHGDRNNRAVDDLRFLFGYKIDINKLVQNFPQVF